MITDCRLLAVDPTGCGCTECQTGDYVPFDQATDDQIQALFLGIVSDHTDTPWTITQTLGGFFIVTADNRQFDIDHLALPVTVKHYTLDLFPAAAVTHRDRLGARPADTSRYVLSPTGN